MEDSKEEFGMDGEEENGSETDSDDSFFYDENEVDELLDEALPEDLKRAPKRRKLNPEDHDLIKNLGNCNYANSGEKRKSSEGRDGDGEKEDTHRYNEKVVMILEEKGKSKFDDLPGGWIQVRHVSGMPLFLHRKTRVCTLSKPYRLGPGSARRHSMPLSAIPCLAYRKALARESTLKSDSAQATEAGSTSELKQPIKVEVENGSESEPVTEANLQEEEEDLNITKEDMDSLSVSTPNVDSAESDSVTGATDSDLPSLCPVQKEEMSMETTTTELEPGEIEDDDDDDDDMDINLNKGMSVLSSREGSSTCPYKHSGLHTQSHSEADEVRSALSLIGGKLPSTPIQHRLKLFLNDKFNDGNVVPPEVAKSLIPKAQVETSQAANELNSVNPEELREYCMKLFKFKQFTCKRFKSWRDRRKHTKEQKRLHLQRPTLPEGVQLITFPVQRPAGESDSGKALKEYTMNPQGKSSVCILHEYVQHALRMQPSYTFGEIRNSASPYAATVMINNVKYGIGYGTSKKLAKAAAASATLEILIPEMKDVLKTTATASNEVYHIGYFDQVEMDDPRIPKMCASVSEPSPYALLLACLQRNFGQGSTSDIKFEVVSTNGQANRFRMQSGEHTVEVTASNKREGKQLASQSMLCKIHPHIKNFGSFLRLYGNGSIKSVKEKKQEEQQITTLQSKASANSPNYAILSKLKEEMLKLRQKRDKDNKMMITEGTEAPAVAAPVAGGSCPSR